MNERKPSYTRVMDTNVVVVAFGEKPKPAIPDYGAPMTLEDAFPDMAPQLIAAIRTHKNPRHHPSVTKLYPQAPLQPPAEAPVISLVQDQTIEVR